MSAHQCLVRILLGFTREARFKTACVPNQTKMSGLSCYLGNQGFTEDWDKKLQFIEDISAPPTHLNRTLSRLSSYLCALIVVLCGKILWLVKETMEQRIH